MKVSPEQFVTIWQNSSSLKDVIQKTGLSRNAVNMRSSYYRRKGVPLKKLTHQYKADFVGLAELAKSLNHS